MPVVDRNETSSERRNIQVDLWVLDVFETRAREVDYAAAACRGRHCESRQRKHNSFAQIQNKQLDTFLYLGCAILLPSPALREGRCMARESCGMTTLSKTVGTASLHRLEQLISAAKNRAPEGRDFRAGSRGGPVGGPPGGARRIRPADRAETTHLQKSVESGLGMHAGLLHQCPPSILR